jgi:hypothetical protein
MLPSHLYWKTVPSFLFFGQEETEKKKELACAGAAQRSAR